MAVAYASQANTGWVTANDVTVTKPSGLAVGDLMFFWLVTNGNNVGSGGISGWTYVGLQGIIGTARVSYLAYKIADSGDVAASNFTWSDIDAGTAVAIGVIIRVTGNSNLGSLIVTNTVDTGKVQNTGTPSLTGITPPSRGDNLLLQLWNAETGVGSIASYAIATSNPSWTEVVEVADGTNKCISAAWGIRPEITATGNFSCAGGGGTTDWNGWIIGVTHDQNTTVSDSMTMTDAKTQKTLITRTESISMTESLTSLAQRIWTTVTKNVSTWINQDKS